MQRYWLLWSSAVDMIGPVCHRFEVFVASHYKLWNVAGKCIYNREYFKPFGGKIFEDTRKKGEGAKTGASHDWWSYYLSQYDWLKGSHMTKVVWLPNETDYSYCEFVVPKYSLLFVNKDSWLGIRI